MTYFLKSGSTFAVTTKESLDLHETLPAGNYVIKFSQDRGFFLDACDSFEIPRKLYGDTARVADRILKTFQDRSGSTGILLAGEKGSGKTMLAKYVSTLAAELGIPTLMVNAPYSGASFNSFIEAIDQPTIIFFDEFEKVYDREVQDQILTLLDGTVMTKNLFILTVNDRWAMSTFLQNRPGRIFYARKFGGLELGFVKEYVADNLKNQDNAESIYRVFELFDKFNFDMLKALVEEMNRYDEKALESLKFLNIEVEKTRSVYEIVEGVWDGMKIKKPKNDKFNLSPYSETLYRTVYHDLPEKKKVTPIKRAGQPVAVDLFDEDDEDNDVHYFDIEFSPKDIQRIVNGRIIYKNEHGSLEVDLVRNDTYDPYSYMSDL